jgi:hypothetical protein
LKITAYKVVDDHLILKPGEKKREWMDSTPDSYAYRCLPLTIANSSGWDLISPCDLMVAWNGGGLQEDLTIHFEDEFYRFATSTFGAGILTIHSGYLFRTSPGFNLEVTGPPNYFYDFMQPCTGIVETWWLSFTFTMNWKLMHPGTFHIKKGDKLGFIKPSIHDLDIITETKSIEDNPTLQKDFDEYSIMRFAINHQVKIAYAANKDYKSVKLNDKSTQWQKHYYRGVDIHDNKVHNHKTNVKYPKFEGN